MSGTRRERMDADAKERGLDFLADAATGEAGGRLNAPEVAGDGGVWRANGFCLNQEQFNRLARMDGMLVDTAGRACDLLALIAASEALSQIEEVAAAFPPMLRAELGQHIEQLQAIYHWAAARAVVSDTISIQALNARFDFDFATEEEAARIARHYTPRPRR